VLKLGRVLAVCFASTFQISRLSSYYELMFVCQCRKNVILLGHLGLCVSLVTWDLFLIIRVLNLLVLLLLMHLNVGPTSFSWDKTQCAPSRYTRKPLCPRPDHKFAPKPAQFLQQALNLTVHPKLWT
jgi:hypothetical protein